MEVREVIFQGDRDSNKSIGNTFVALTSKSLKEFETSPLTGVHLILGSCSYIICSLPFTTTLLWTVTKYISPLSPLYLV